MLNSRLFGGFFVLVLGLGMIFSFQNCSSEMQFQDIQDFNSVLGGINPEDVICDPLEPGAICDYDSNMGLVGYLYYLTEDQAGLFNGSLRNTVLSDYINYGYKVDKVVFLNKIDVEAQSWETGFQQKNGQMVKDLNGNDLFEWFSLDMYGYISLPEGDYQFAMVSDDGMRLELNDNVVLNDDGLHAPRWSCSGAINFLKDERKTLHMQYFQGPRNQVAMQLLYRSNSQSGMSCDETGGWQVVPAQAYSFL